MALTEPLAQGVHSFLVELPGTGSLAKPAMDHRQVRLAHLDERVPKRRSLGVVGETGLGDQHLEPRFHTQTTKAFDRRSVSFVE